MPWAWQSTSNGWVPVGLRSPAAEKRSVKALSLSVSVLPSRQRLLATVALVMPYRLASAALLTLGGACSARSTLSDVGGRQPHRVGGCFPPVALARAIEISNGRPQTRVNPWGRAKGALRRNGEQRGKRGPNPARRGVRRLARPSQVLPNPCENSRFSRAQKSPENVRARESWWCSLAFFQTRLRRRCMQVWKSAGFCQKCPQRFAANGTDSRQVGQHPALGFLCVQRVNQGPADTP